MANWNVKIKKDKIPYFWSMSFLVLVILMTISLFLYNWSIVKDNSQLRTKVLELDSSILNIEKEDSFKVFSLIKSNRDTIDWLIERTKIVKYINHMQKIWEDYDLLFRWFKLSWLNLETWIILKSDWEWLAYKKLVNFIDNYRKDKDALFNLNFINRVSWYENIKINLNFSIKNNK